MRRVRKFKYKPTAGMFVAFEATNSSDPDAYDEFTLKSGDEPRGTLITQLNAMSQHVVDLCELPADYAANIQVIGITVTYSDDDIQGLGISALRTLENTDQPMVLNTPHFTRDPYSPTAPSDVGVFSGRCAADLDRLEELIFDYVDGDRAQMDLFGYQEATG